MTKLSGIECFTTTMCSSKAFVTVNNQCPLFFVPRLIWWPPRVSRCWVVLGCLLLACPHCILLPPSSPHPALLCRLLVCCWFLATKSQGRGCKSRFLTSVLYAPRPSCWWADFRLGKSFEPWLHWGSGCFIAPGLSLWGCGVWRLWQTEIPRSRRPKSFVWKPTRCSWTSTRYVWGKKIIHRTTSD